jgi:hypothetical protein
VEYSGERLMACRNPSLASLRAKKREELLAVTEGKLRLIQAGVEAGRHQGAEAIGLTVGKVIDHYKVGKHFDLDIGERHFSLTRKHQAIEAEAALDGIDIIRMNVPAEPMEAAECVRNYKALADVERAFRSLKTTDLKVRPIYHCTPDRVRAPLFLCVLAYYVEWHLREAWRELMFADADLSAQATRDPVAPAQRSSVALDKTHRRRLDDGTPVQRRFSTLMAELSTFVRSTCACRAPRTMCRPSKDSPRPRNTAYSTSSNTSECSQKPEPQTHGKPLLLRGKFGWRREELRIKLQRVRGKSSPPAGSGAAPQEVSKLVPRFTHPAARSPVPGRLPHRKNTVRPVRQDTCGAQDRQDSGDFH